MPQPTWRVSEAPSGGTQERRPEGERGREAGRGNLRGLLLGSRLNHRRAMPRVPCLLQPGSPGFWGPAGKKQWIDQVGGTCEVRPWTLGWAGGMEHGFGESLNSGRVAGGVFLAPGPWRGALLHLLWCMPARPLAPAPAPGARSLPLHMAGCRHRGISIAASPCVP